MGKGYKSVGAMLRAMKRERNKYRKEHPILDVLQTFYYRVICRLIDFFKDDFYRLPKRFIQRGIRGYSNEDTWGLSEYLARVIAESVRHLKENNHGMPNNLTEGQWIDILNKIINTFEIAERLGDDLYLLRDPKMREKFQKTLDEGNKKFNQNERCLSPKEIRAYDEGWTLFKTHFNSLWD